MASRFLRSNDLLHDVDALAAPPRAARYRRARSAGDRAYRGALVVVLLMSAAIAATWLASREVLAALSEGAAWASMHSDDRARALATVVFAAVALIALIAAWGRATAPARPVRLAGGRGRMAVGAIAHRLEEAMLARGDVHGAAVAVANRHWRGVRVEARLRVTALARLEDTIAAFEAEAEELLHERLGVPLERRPRVELQYDELDLRAGRMHD